jgi:ABC-type transporter Mla subunit MlaD
MPDLLKMKAMVDALERTIQALETMSDRLEKTMDRMAGTLQETQDTIKQMASSVDSLADRTSTAIENMNQKFDRLIDTLVSVSTESVLLGKNPLSPRSLVNTAKDLTDSLVPDFLKRPGTDSRPAPRKAQKPAKPARKITPSGT